MNIGSVVHDFVEKYPEKASKCTGIKKVRSFLIFECRKDNLDWNVEDGWEVDTDMYYREGYVDFGVFDESLFCFPPYDKLMKEYKNAINLLPNYKKYFK